MNPESPTMVNVLYYNDGQIGAVPVVSITFGDNGRRRVLGELANGDILSVPVQDVIARPDLFRAPCGKPYAISGQMVIDPCEEMVEDLPLESMASAEEELSPPPILTDERKAIGEATASPAAVDILAKAGYVTLKSVMDMDEGELSELIGVKAAAAVARYKEGDARPKRRAKRTSK